MTEYLLYLFSMSFTPGPNVILATANASQKGFPKCLTLVAGMVSGLTLIHVISFFTVSFLLSVVSSIEVWLKILGVVYLIWLAVGFFRKKSLSKSDETGGFKKGFILQFLNVKLYMLCVTSASNFVLPMGLSMGKSFLLYMMGPLFCFVSQLVWSFFGVALTKLYSKHARLLNILFGLSLLFLAISNIRALIR